MTYENSTFSILSQLINKYSTPITCLYNKKQVMKTSQGKYYESSTMPSRWLELCQTSNSITQLFHFLIPLFTGKLVQSLILLKNIVSSNICLPLHSRELFSFSCINIFSCLNKLLYSFWSRKQIGKWRSLTEGSSVCHLVFLQWEY